MALATLDAVLGVGYDPLSLDGPGASTRRKLSQAQPAPSARARSRLNGDCLGAFRPLATSAHGLAPAAPCRDRAMSEGLESYQVASGTAAEIQQIERRRHADVRQQGADVLAHVVVARVFPVRLGLPVVVRQRACGDSMQFFGGQGHAESLHAADDCESRGSESAHSANSRTPGPPGQSPASRASLTRRQARGACRHLAGCGPFALRRGLRNVGRYARKP